MTQGQFLKALEIISSHHSSQITINQPVNDFVGDLGTKKWTIHINKCVPAVIKQLIADGFILSMGEHGISVDFIG